MTTRLKFIRATQGVLIIFGCLLFLYHPAFLPAYYRPWLMGLTAILYSFCIQLPALVFSIPSHSTAASSVERQLFYRERLQVGLSIGFLLGGLGSLGFWGLYKVGIPYDKFIHFIFPVLVIVPASSLLRALYGWSWKKSLILLALAACVSGIAWEFVEYASFHWLRFGFFGQLFDSDSLRDIYTTFLGVGVAAVFLVRREWSNAKSSSTM